MLQHAKDKLIKGEQRAALLFSGIAAISVGFVIWSALFIYQSSGVAIDGKRYFSLFDDAMISMRYAWNLTHGLGLVWNSGERVEGYTNPLMTLVMAFFTWTFDKSSAVLAVQALGIILMLVIAFQTMFIGDELFRGQTRYKTLRRLLTFFSGLAYYPLTFWSLMGMETGLLSVLILFAVWYALRFHRSNRTSDFLLVPVFLGLAFLTRADSAVLATPILVFLFYEAYKARKNAFIAPALIAIVMYGAILAGFEAFRITYYGELLPNTYYLKLSGVPIFTRLSNGVRFLLPFLLTISPVLLLTAASVVNNFTRPKALILVLVISVVVYQIWIGGDPWPYWRIPAPVITILLALFVGELLFTTPSIVNSSFFKSYIPKNAFISDPKLTPIIGCFSLIFVLIIANLYFLTEIAFLQKPYSAPENVKNINKAIALNEVTTQDSAVGVFWAGSIPYYTGRTAIDFLGKSDRYIASLAPDLSGAVSWSGMSSVPGHNKYDLCYSVVSKKPTYVQNFKWGGQDLRQWADSNYVNINYKGVSLYLLKDSSKVLWERIDSGTPNLISQERSSLTETRC